VSNFKIIESVIWFVITCECGNEVAITDWGWILCGECGKREYGVDILGRDAVPLDSDQEAE
jgi:hypothetical protein